LSRKQTATWPRAKRTTVALLIAAALSIATPPKVRADDLVEAQKQGLALIRAGDPKKAIPYLRKALDLAEAQYGRNDQNTALDLNNLAEATRLAGHYDEAAALYERAVAIDEGNAGDKVGLATSLNNLALVYRAQNRLDEAENLYLRSLAILEKILGPTDPDVAKSLNNLAMLYRSRGETEKALPLQERAVMIAGKSLGKRHSTTLTLEKNLAALGGTRAPESKSAPAPEAPVFVPRPTLVAHTVQAPENPTEPPPIAPVTTAGSAASLRLHLGSVRSDTEVPDEWQRLLRRHPDLASLSLLPAQRVEIVGKGTFFRVLADWTGSEADAERLCADLAHSGDACRVLRP
jgi:tetratricopeptide (TPR) repeat protein